MPPCRCYGTGICPSKDQVPSTVTCNGELPEGTCPNGTTSICNDGTWTLSCDSSDSSKKCQDTQVPPKQGDPIYPTPCYVTCKCRQ